MSKQRLGLAVAVLVVGGVAASACGGNGEALEQPSVRAEAQATLTAGGEPLWTRRMLGSSPSNFFSHVDHDAAGNVIVAGTYAGSARLGDVTLPAPGPDSPDMDTVVIAKLRPDGSVAWSHFLTPEPGQRSCDASSHALAVDAQGYTYFGGLSTCRTRFGPFTVGGFTQWGWNEIIAKISPTGEVVWARNTRARAPASFAFQDFTVDASGDLIALSYFDPGTGNGTTMVTKYNASTGATRFDVFLPFDGAVELDTDAAQNIYIVGMGRDSFIFDGKERMPADSEFQHATVLVSLSPAGAPRWSRVYRGRLLRHGLRHLTRAEREGRGRRMGLQLGRKSVSRGRSLRSSAQSLTPGHFSPCARASAASCAPSASTSSRVRPNVASTPSIASASSTARHAPPASRASGRFPKRPTATLQEPSAHCSKG